LDQLVDCATQGTIDVLLDFLTLVTLIAEPHTRLCMAKLKKARDQLRRVYKSGHEVPFYQPCLSLAMFGPRYHMER